MPEKLASPVLAKCSYTCAHALAADLRSPEFYLAIHRGGAVARGGAAGLPGTAAAARTLGRAGRAGVRAVGGAGGLSHARRHGVEQQPVRRGLRSAANRLDHFHDDPSLPPERRARPLHRPAPQPDAHHPRSAPATHPGGVLLRLVPGRRGRFRHARGGDRFDPDRVGLPRAARGRAGAAGQHSPGALCQPGHAAGGAAIGHRSGFAPADFHGGAATDHL